MKILRPLIVLTVGVTLMLTMTACGNSGADADASVKRGTLLQAEGSGTEGTREFHVTTGTDWRVRYSYAGGWFALMVDDTKYAPADRFAQDGHDTVYFDATHVGAGPHTIVIGGLSTWQITVEQ